MNTAAEEIWTILRETAKLQKETKESMKETDRRMQETDRKMQETDRQMQETDRKMQETDKKIKEMSVSIGRLGNKLGDFVEEMVRPAAVRLFRERGIEVHEVHRNIEAQRGGEGIEIDLLVVNDSDVVAIECKSTLSIDDVNAHLARLGHLKKLLPTYTNKRVLGAITGMVIPDQVARYAYSQGLYLIAQSGDHLLIRNDAGFVPRSW
ncbi:MAG: DUF3782 domain-containing protein [Methylovulum sp.]|nr:DUF3782 domain-containing protein [Methylovulum sp.]